MKNKFSLFNLTKISKLLFLSFFCLTIINGNAQDNGQENVGRELRKRKNNEVDTQKKVQKKEQEKIPFIFECPFKICNTKFSNSIGEYKNHLNKKHHNQLIFSCPSSGCNFESIYAWPIVPHFRKKHSGTGEICDHCNEEFPNSGYLMTHYFEVNYFKPESFESGLKGKFNFCDFNLCHIAKAKYIPYKRNKNKDEMNSVDQVENNDCGSSDVNKKSPFDQINELSNFGNFVFDENGNEEQSKIFEWNLESETQEEIATHECLLCQQVFIDKEELKDHECVEHLGYNSAYPHPCPRCGENIEEITNLYIHYVQEHPN